MKLEIKDKIKFNYLPRIVSFVNLFGVKFQHLAKFPFLAKSIILVQASKLAKSGRYQTNEGQDIYILELLSGSIYHLITESLIGLGLKLRGHNVTMIIDDNTFPIHELKKINEEDSWNYKAFRDFCFAKKFLSNLGLNYVSVNDFTHAKKRELKYDTKYESILEATLLKHYKVGIVSDSLPKLEEKKALIKRSISISEIIGKRLKDLNPDSVIMSHGIYSTWGPAFNVLQENNIDVLVHGRGKKKHSKVFNWNKTGDSWDVSQKWEEKKTKELTSGERKEILDYLDSRISHKDDVFVYNFGEKISNKETIEYLGLDSSKPIYSLFTNVLWDAASAQREIAFDNPVDWVIETINWFNSCPEKQLIVKIHPAEVVIGTNMPFYDIILSKITPRDNVRIIRPEEKVNSWSIYNISELGIVHTTTAGMELPLVMKPCIVVSKTHYRGKGFTIDINSKKDYFDCLELFDSEKINYKSNKEIALKYAHLLFIEYQIPFNLFYEDVSTVINGFRNVNMNDYFLDRSFTKVINSIENKKDIFNS